MSTVDEWEVTAVANRLPLPDDDDSSLHSSEEWVEDKLKESFHRDRPPCQELRSILFTSRGLCEKRGGSLFPCSLVPHLMVFYIKKKGVD